MLISVVVIVVDNCHRRRCRGLERGIFPQHRSTAALLPLLACIYLSLISDDRRRTDTHQMLLAVRATIPYLIIYTDSTPRATCFCSEDFHLAPTTNRKQHKNKSIYPAIYYLAVLALALEFGDWWPYLLPGNAPCSSLCILIDCCNSIPRSFHLYYTSCVIIFVFCKNGRLSWANKPAGRKDEARRRPTQHGLWS